MISYYQDTQTEYRGGYCNSSGRQTLINSRRHIPEIAKRSYVQLPVSIFGAVCPQSGGSSE
ncbi:hypothetical protein DSECCO2_529150 [anaerobic digester metagenome]